MLCFEQGKFLVCAYTFSLLLNEIGLLLKVQRGYKKGVTEPQSLHCLFFKKSKYQLNFEFGHTFLSVTQ